jgi:nucleoside-diphosphate-sugar epimerase
MTSDGSPWRPLVHALDIAKAIRMTLESPRDRVHGEIFNVGDTRQNYRVREIAEVVSATFPGCALTIGKNDGDNRSYRVSFDKIHERLPNFQCRRDAATGARQLLDVFTRIDMAPATFDSPSYTRLKQLQHLLTTEQIDADFFWTAP